MPGKGEQDLTRVGWRCMQTITVKCKLILSDEQREAIDKTMEAFAQACNDAIRRPVSDQPGSLIDLSFQT